MTAEQSASIYWVKYSVKCTSVKSNRGKNHLDMCPWFDSHWGHMSERFFRSNRPGYPHPVSSELENSGIRVVVGDCSVTERRRWRPPYQTGKTVHVHAKHYKHNEDGCTAPGVCSNGSEPLSHLGKVVTRIGIHIHTESSEQAEVQTQIRVHNGTNSSWSALFTNIFIKFLKTDLLKG